MREALEAAGFTNVNRAMFHDLDDVMFNEWLGKVAAYRDDFFDDEADFLRHSIFMRLDRLKQIPLWMACGTSDRFYPGNVELARSLPNARTVFDRGGHTTAYSRAHWGDGMAWLARQL